MTPDLSNRSVIERYDRMIDEERGKMQKIRWNGPMVNKLKEAFKKYGHSFHAIDKIINQFHGSIDSEDIMYFRLVLETLSKKLHQETKIFTKNVNNSAQNTEMHMK